MGNGIKYCRTCWEAKLLTEFPILIEDIYDDFCLTCIVKESKSNKAANEKSYLKLKEKREKREQDIKDGIITIIDDYYDEPLIKRRAKKRKTERVYEFVEFKKCLKCEQVLSRSKFYPHLGTNDGLNNKCKVCCRSNYTRKLKVINLPVPEPGFKRCRKCLEVFPLDNYHKDEHYKDKLYPVCRACRSAVRKKSYKEKKIRQE